jgi:hypothetical protein
MEGMKRGAAYVLKTGGFNHNLSKTDEEMEELSQARGHVSVVSVMEFSEDPLGCI